MDSSSAPADNAEPIFTAENLQQNTNFNNITQTNTNPNNNSVNDNHSPVSNVSESTTPSMMNKNSLNIFSNNPSNDNSVKSNVGDPLSIIHQSNNTTTNSNSIKKGVTSETTQLLDFHNSSVGADSIKVPGNDYNIQKSYQVKNTISPTINCLKKSESYDKIANTNNPFNYNATNVINHPNTAIIDTHKNQSEKAPQHLITSSCNSGNESEIYSSNIGINNLTTQNVINNKSNNFSHPDSKLGILNNTIANNGIQGNITNGLNIKRNNSYEVLQNNVMNSNNVSTSLNMTINNVLKSNAQEINEHNEMVSLPYIECGISALNNGFTRIKDFSLKAISLQAKTLKTFVNVVHNTGLFGANTEVSIPLFNQSMYCSYQNAIPDNQSRFINNQPEIYKTGSTNAFNSQYEQNKISQPVNSRCHANLYYSGIPNSDTIYQDLKGQAFSNNTNTDGNFAHQYPNNCINGANRSHSLSRINSSGSLSKPNHQEIHNYPFTDTYGSNNALNNQINYRFNDRSTSGKFSRIPSAQEVLNNNQNGKDLLLQKNDLSITRLNGNNKNIMSYNSSLNDLNTTNGKISVTQKQPIIEGTSLPVTRSGSQLSLEESNNKSCNNLNNCINTNTENNNNNNITTTNNNLDIKQENNQDGSFGTYVDVLPTILHESSTNGKQRISGTQSLMKNFRSSTKFSDEQTLILIQAFSKNPRPQLSEINYLSQISNLKVQQIKVWYQNKRSRYINKKSAKKNITDKTKNDLEQKIDSNTTLQNKILNSNINQQTDIGNTVDRQSANNSFSANSQEFNDE